MTSTIHLTQELLRNIQCSDDSKSFAKEMRAFKMRSTMHSHWKLRTTNWEDHWSWSSHNYMRSCWRTQHQPFYSHLAFEAKLERWKTLISGCLMSSLKIKKVVILKCHFLLLYATRNRILWGCDAPQKWILYNNWQWLASSVVGLRRSSKALPKAKLHQKKGHCPCLVICCQSDLL